LQDTSEISHFLTTEEATRAFFKGVQVLIWLTSKLLLGLELLSNFWVAHSPIIVHGRLRVGFVEMTP